MKMKKMLDIVITLCTLICGVVLLALCNSESVRQLVGIEELENGVGLPMIVAIFNLLIFAVRIILFFIKMKAKSSKPMSDSESSLKRFIDRQRSWVEDWCEYMLDHTKRTAYLTAVGIGAGFPLLAYFTGSPLNQVIIHFLPMGLLVGEGFAIILWAAQRSQSKSGKILKRLRKGVEKAFPDASAQEDFAADMLSTGDEWTVSDKGKSTMFYGIVGSRYWVAFNGTGGVTVVTPYYLKKIETAVESGSVRVNKVRTYYQNYGARFYYQNGNPKVCDRAFCFESEEGMGLFMVLVRKRVGDSIEITTVN